MQSTRPEAPVTGPAVYRDRPRRRGVGRHIRAGVTLLVLLGFVAGAAWYAWRALTEPEPDDTTVTEPCVPAPDDAELGPGDVELNVYNATQRGGLAGRTADVLRGRGFVILDVANDPLRKTIEGTAEVRGNPEQQALAAVVLAQVPDATFIPDDRAETTLDLVLGEAFHGLFPIAEVELPTATPAPDATAAPVC